jgi:hypothetical protein
MKVQRSISEIKKLGCKYIYDPDPKKSTLQVIDTNNTSFGSGGVSQAIVEKRNLQRDLFLSSDGDRYMLTKI